MARLKYDGSRKKGLIGIFNCQTIRFLFRNVVPNDLVDNIHFIILIRNILVATLEQTISQVANVLIDCEIYGERGCKLSKLSTRIKVSNLTS